MNLKYAAIDNIKISHLKVFFKEEYGALTFFLIK